MQDDTIRTERASQGSAFAHDLPARGGAGADETRVADASARTDAASSAQAAGPGPAGGVSSGPTPSGGAAFESDRAEAAGADTQRVVLVTGPSGAGRSTAINVLEDLGFEAIDNLPLSLIPRLLDGPARPAPLALGLDVRNRDFSAANVIELIDRLTRAPGYAPEVLYLDCHADVLVRRYGETRRRHPLAPDEAPMAGVLAEISLLAAIRGRADVLVDTAELSPHDLKAELTRWFALRPDRRLGVSLHSFSYKRGVPRGLDLMFDCRFLANPHWEPALRPLDGRDARVQAHVGRDPRFAEFFARTRDLVRFLLPAHMDEGKSHLAVGFGCTGGQHRSVTLVENMAVALAEAGWPVSIRHRELERRAAAVPPGSDVAQADVVRMDGAQAGRGRAEEAQAGQPVTQPGRAP